MDIGNRNTNRVKIFMRKRFRIAVFFAVLLGIALTVFRYFEFVSKTVYEESVSHLTEIFHQSDNMLSELTNKNLTYLHIWGEYLQNTSDESEIREYIEKAQEDAGFLDFYFLSADGNYKMATGETGYLGLQENIEDEIRQGNDVITNATVPGKSQLLVFATPRPHGSYQGFEYDAIAIAYENSDIVNVLNISAFNGNAQSYVVHPDGRVVVDHSSEAWGEVYNFFGILREHSNMSEKEILKLSEEFKEGHTDAMLINLDGKDYYLLYYVSSGTGQLSFSEKKLELYKGDLFALFPGETAALCADREKPWVLHWVGFSGCRASNLLHKTVLQRDRILQGVGETKLPLYIRRIHEVAVNDEDEEILECRLVSELYSFLGEALSECRLLYDKGALGERDIAKRAVEAIHARYSDGLCVSQLAKEIHVSRSYLYEVFEAETGVSPKEYLDSLRLSKACGLLHIHEEYSDEKVAAMVGFSEPRNFIKKFKERFHMTPIEYRKSTKATPSENMIDRKVDYTESIEFNFPHDGNKTVYPTTLKEQIEALKKDPVLAHFAECRAAAKRDRHTPLYHFSNPNGGLNDPNGPCFWQGRWHLFYQHIMPLAEGDRTIYWGHAVSSALIHWVDLPDAIYPNPEKECWSGSTCVEDNKVTALWYGFRGHGGHLCANSDDPLLLNWNKIYPDPVIPGQVGQCGDKPYDVYDPCIWRHGEYYYALAGCHMPNPVTGHWMRVEYLFRSKDCLDWEYRHPFVKEDWFSEINDDGACPYFVPLGDKHLLMHFCHARGPEYLVGKYDTENECFIPAFGKRFNLYKCSGLHAPALGSDG